jgi:hypothetical protein
MSDEQSQDASPAAATPAGIWEHRCEHNGCSAWGLYGYQIGKQAPHWYCGEHRDKGERLIGRG